ncbi:MULTISPECIES: 2-keto-4-pentenoate hydratase [Burkholderia]|uniref:2-keto-4-pentenoate hydratase n=2 Tax=Burkholderia lata (strain ATCC 17760 / DSM 23089 / LMG 22485 / NCIMB 9086 / R18194 / 383) TaxID=482957 RepID=Q397R1_BURL3|nr:MULTISPECIES: fumarylacetoacetate hydrolase family protein [Burkholderia]ABB11300.1 2-keto-4-pentenoate hydratase [Burkholderia lata]KAF1041071.1 MAG: 2-oxopent-4-enoate hydratase [Burkholderia lata]MBN3768133.1 2-keto-4-pentenoate hydratase [Burkholderia sp. Se-20378]VWB23392.1 2-keto-4-pentenoate hydratase [Burkholderia lata]
MNVDQIQHVADRLRRAESTGDFIEPLHRANAALSIDDAYAIQQLNIQRRISAGSRRVGCKIGLTSAAVQKQLGVDQPDFGVLLDDMAYGDQETVPWSALSQPKIEAEVAFVMGRDIACDNPGHLDLLHAIEYVLPALEIVGSRIRDWEIGIVDTIADNASSSAFVLGNRPVKLSDVDLRLCGMVTERRGEVVSLGVGAACMGHPVNALVWLARTMAARGVPLRAGDVVLSGALGPMVNVRPGDVFEAQIQGLGAVRASFDDAEA